MHQLAYRRAVPYIEFVSMILIKQISISALVILYLGVTVLLPFAHRHAHVASSDLISNIQSHDCGSREIHKSIESSHCLLCPRDSSPAAVFVNTSPVRGTHVHVFVHHKPKAMPSLCEFLSEPDRGPPAVAA
jgi:hypothetical protein